MQIPGEGFTILQQGGGQEQEQKQPPQAQVVMVLNLPPEFKKIHGLIFGWFFNFSLFTYRQAPAEDCPTCSKELSASLARDLPAFWGN